MARRSRRPADQPQRSPLQTPTTRPTHHQKPDRTRYPDPGPTLRASSENKRGFGFHPLWSFVDHGAAGTGEPLSVLLRPGNAGSNTATDHIAVIKAALAQLPAHHPGRRAGRKVLIRTDGAGCTHKVLTWMSGQRLSYSVGFPLPHNTSELLELIPAGVWTPAYDAHDQIRDGAWVAELTALLDMTGWPAGMRVIVRKERPHPGAQLRITDVDGHRVTAFATNTKTGGPGTQLPDLDLRHRRRARCEDRIRVSKDTGVMNLPLRVCPESDLVRHRGSGRGDHRVDADARPERAPSQAVGTKTVAATPVHPPGDDRAHRPAGPPSPRDQSPLGRPRQRRRSAATSSGRPWLMFTPPVPTTTARPPATWNRRPPETTLGPPSHPNDKITTSRRPAAATTLNTRGVKDRG
jgi:Transposase DDE domain group 1